MKKRECCRCNMSAVTLVTRLMVLCTLCASVTSRYVLRSFSDATNTGQFNHLIVDENTGTIYLGAVNRLYQLSPTLSIENKVITGPKKDNPNCPVNGECECLEEDCSESLKKKPTDSINKALVINYATQKIIVCSSLFQGHCEKRKLADLDQKDEPIYEPMVPNDRNSSVVVFIGPGPAVGNGQPSQVLYIGATRSLVGLDAFRDLVPTVCSRNIQTFFLAKKSFFSTKKEIESTLRKRFLVKYVHGFSSGGFSYFLTVQKESTESMSGNNYVSRLVRVCQNDDKYFSYTEIPFKCQHNGSYYNILRAAVVGKAGHNLALSLGIPTTEDVLFALFSKSVSDSDEATGESALCIYSMRSIRTKFTENIKQCFNGVGNTGPAHIAKPQSCYKTELPITDDYCGKYDINTPIAGTLAAEETAVLVMHNTKVTSIAVTVTSNYTVSFIGTSTGILRKVVIESKTKAVIYEDIQVEANKMILSDLNFDRTRNSLYVLTQKKVTQVQVHKCDFYKTCGECLGARDPFCGWCNLESKCSVRSECQNQNIRWLPYDGLQCTKITSVHPPEVQIQSQPTTRLRLDINNLPTLTYGNYQCAFKGYDVIHTTSATKTNDHSIECETPYYNLLPPIPTGSDHIVMTLSVRMNGKDFISTNFTFFDCGTHNSCTRCTKSAFPCTWCIENHKCTNNKEVCGTDILVTGQNTPGNTDRPGPQSCPRIESSFTEILVPSGKTKIISVKALNLQPFQTNFRCNFNIDGGKEVAGRKVAGTEQIECDEVKFQYSSHTADLNVPFVITWGRNKALDNPTVIQVKVYKCSVMADNCGSCLTLESKYNCGWCSPTCSTENECTPASKWLDRSSICPNPQINSFYPISGPVKGGTTITIEGVNLGKVFDDIKDGVIVAGVPCEARKKFYVPAKRIVCVTGSSHQPRSDQINVMVKNRYRGISAQKFSYVESMISDINPSKGPQSGGTRLTIFGTHMNAGTNITARAAGLSCHLVETKENAVVCITSVSNSTMSGMIEMYFDRARATYTGRYFSYVADPVVKKVTPLKSILSGGNLIAVEGEGLNAVSQPKMLVIVNGVHYESDCTVNSAKSMGCYSPNIMRSGLLVSVEKPLLVTFGFIMDNVVELRNLTASHPFLTFHYVPNPEFEEFENGIKFFQKKTEYLTINGKNLNLALQKEDIRVMIGKRYCNVTSIAPTQLTCKPPTQQHNGDTSKVVVIAGRNLTFEIGELSYEESGAKLGDWMIIAISAGAGLVVIILLVFVIVFRIKSRKNDREIKRMQNQMDVLEARVAKECKEAFAELQTDMTEITSDLGGIGIPFREYRSFAMRVLFPSTNEDQHPVTRSLEVDISKKESMERGLRLFNQLISNKTFLLLLIRTLENNEDFTMRERVNFASLVSVALQDRMEYYTDILKTLLSDLIERAMDKPNHNKLLLRRTEYVAEKMLTNWFTFLLYKFLKECAGEPLFMLYRAIKQQMDKGPVDVVSSEARYSLSEDKLIRQQIDYNTLTIYALDPDIQYGTQEHPVKVLDCDTISQTKEKILDAIYKNQPFSSRPDKDDLELEWRTGLTGRIVLQDEDVTTKTEGDHKRINTLLHYKVPDGAVMALVPRQSSHYNLSIHSDKSGSGSHRFNAYGTNQSLGAYSTYLAGSPALSRSVSPNTINIDMDSGVKFYHLVKPHDSDTQKEGDRSSKMVSEIYLTRLLTTKGTLQQFVDDLFETIFSTTHRGSALPLAIKYMFDFLDDQALSHGQDPDVVHTWKSNSLPLRFWVNVMKNPDFVFDIHKSNIVDSCLSVVAQTFMDSCSISDHKLSKDSPSSKLLYAKEIPKYKKWVERYYQDIKMMPAISDQDMNATLAEESRHHQNEFNLNAALHELYQYVVRYNDKLFDALEEDEFARKNRLTYKLEQVHNCMESEA